MALGKMVCCHSAIILKVLILYAFLPFRGEYMGLFGFGKKKEALSLDDIPPPPPPPDTDFSAPPSDIEIPPQPGEFPEPPPMSGDEQSIDMPTLAKGHPEEASDINLPKIENEGFDISQPEPDVPQEEAPVPDEPAEPEMPEAPMPVPEMPQPMRMEKKAEPESGPLYIPLNKYKEVDDTVDKMDLLIKNAGTLVDRLADMNQKKTANMDRLFKNAEFILKRLSAVDKKIFKKG